MNNLYWKQLAVGVKNLLTTKSLSTEVLQKRVDKIKHLLLQSQTGHMLGRVALNVRHSEIELTGIVEFNPENFAKQTARILAESLSSNESEANRFVKILEELTEDLAEKCKSFYRELHFLEKTPLDKIVYFF